MTQQIFLRSAKLLVAISFATLFYSANSVIAQSPPTGPAGGDLAGTYPNPVLSADRVRKTGDSMTGPLDISLGNTGGLRYPFSLSSGGNAGPNRGVSFQFNLPANTAAVLGAEMIAARESWGLPSYLSFSTHNGTVVTEALRITSTGRIGIGTGAPAYKLDVAGEINATGIRINGTPVGGGGGSSQWTTSGTSVYYNSGNVGIGTTSPDSFAKLHLYGNGGFGQDIQTSTNDWTRLRLVTPTRTWGFFLDGGLAGLGQGKFGLFDYTANAWRMIADTSGNIGIGTTTPSTKLHVAGSITVDGNINAKYQDVAEWVESSQELTAGTVVVLDKSKSNQVIASTQSYDTRVAGVISARPGIALGETGEDKVLVATTGRVRVRVDAASGPIRIGDLLVTGEKEGFAMKSQPINVGGAQIHRPGTLIGKALEPLEGGTGEILVLLSLQ